jgi:hypothetical protein
MSVIVFSFRGGVRDGQAIRSDGSEPEQREAISIWKQTLKGMIGRRFDVGTPGSPVFQRYQIASKREIDEEVLITCEHVG